jgi:hypothetical protein
MFELFFEGHPVNRRAVDGVFTLDYTNSSIDKIIETLQQEDTDTRKLTFGSAAELSGLFPSRNILVANTHSTTVKLGCLFHGTDARRVFLYSAAITDCDAAKDAMIHGIAPKIGEGSANHIVTALQMSDTRHVTLAEFYHKTGEGVKAVVTDAGYAMGLAPMRQLRAFLKIAFDTCKKPVHVSEYDPQITAASRMADALIETLRGRGRNN